MPLAKANGMEIAYDLLGTGEPLLLIGGFGMTREFWGGLPLALSERFRVVSYDNRGSGKSSVPAEPFTIADMAADAIGLMDSLQIQSACIFGVSMGGMIAQMLCAGYPTRVRRAILGCTTHGGPNGIPSPPEAEKTFEALADPSLSPEAAARMLIPVLFGSTFITGTPERVEAYIRICVEHPQTKSGAIGQMAALMGFDAEKELDGIRTPVLVVTGDEDMLIPQENSMLLARKIPDARLETIAGAGHNFFFEKPDATAALIEGFMPGALQDDTTPP